MRNQILSALMCVVFCLCAFGVDATPSLRLELVGFGGVGITRPDDLNNLAIDWSRASGEEDGSESLEYRPYGVLGAQFSVVWKRLELRPEYLYQYLPLTYDGISSDQLEVATGVNALGMSVGIRLGSFMLSAGLLRYDAEVNWNDSLLVYEDVWSGSDLGYHVSMGLGSSFGSRFIFRAEATYRNVTIDQLTNSEGMLLTNLNENRDFALQISGVDLRLGIGLGFDLGGETQP